VVKMPEDDAVVRRCETTVALALYGRSDTARTMALTADLAQLAPGHPARGQLAADMIKALVRAANTNLDSLRHLTELLSIADASPPTDPQWPATRSMVRLVSQAYAGTQGQTMDLDATEVELDRLGEAANGMPQLNTVVGSARIAFRFMRAFQNGDESAIRRLPEEAAEYFEKLADHPEMERLTGAMNIAAEAMAASRRGDQAEFWQQVGRLQQSAQNFDQGGLMGEALSEASAQTEVLRGVIDGGAGAGPTEQHLAELTARVNRPGASEYDRAVNELVLGGVFQGMGQEKDLTRIDAGIEHFREALRLTPPDRVLHTFCLTSLALGLYRQSEMAGTTDGLAEAEDLLKRALPLLGGPDHPEWGHVNSLLADIHHRMGKIHESGRRGGDAQRSYIWSALLESDDAGTKIAIADAARDGIDLARKHVRAHEPADALRALDTGRGLMLFAATQLRDVPARLHVAGRDDLAERWETDERDSRELRRQVFTVLADQPTATGSLLDPPSLSDIHTALASMDADALVYLVPAAPPLPGLALIAPVDGPPAYMALPNLELQDDSEVERYLTALANRSRDLDPPPDNGDFAGSVAALCDWAWRAAIGPLLDYVERRPARPDGRVPRIVLVPMGDLARIPWHAARRGDGVYAVELVAFSQAVSARLLCDTAAREPVVPTSTGLVVGDPDTGGAARTLHAARLEAHVIRQAFYQGARYVGRRPDGSASPSGRGTAGDVRRWLADRKLSAGSMLHLACHGSFTAEGDDANAFLLLAAGEVDSSRFGELTAEEIVRLMMAAPERQVGLVVLAACHTGRSVHGYDEAYSLGTAFLAGGARSVLSTQWSIPDAETSSLMYMFHHYHRREGLPPWQALRQAQIWMLGRGRQIPEGMPAELLSVPDDEYARTVAWAGFVHFGH
jgi:tetratricopeptide (TPR) repeat protein